MHRLAWLGTALGLTVLLAACSSTGDDDTGEDEGAVAAGSLSYIGKHVVGALADQSPSEQGKTWNLSRGNKLADSFVLQVPLADTWGKDDVRVAARCKADEAGCDPDFLLKRCASDADCGQGGACTALKATVAHRNDAPKKLCIGHADTLLDEVWSAVALAKTSVDMSSLTPPEDRFQAAVRNAVTYASEASSPPRIRMLFGDFPGGHVSGQKTLETLTRDVAPGSRIEVAVGTYREGVDSWNHSKIIVRDQSYAIVGGTNMWDEHYLKRNPVHDLWMNLEGRAARDSSRFLDNLWVHACGKSGMPIVDSRVVASRPEPQKCPDPIDRPNDDGVGGTPVIAMGRLGAVGSNTSDQGLVAFVEAAKKSIRLSQQDIGPVKRVGVSFAPWPEALMTAMVGAMARGVDVSFVLSNPKSVPGNVSAMEAYFNTYDNGWSLEDVGKKFVAIASAHPEVLGGQDPAALVCSKLKLMHLRMGDRETWPSGGTYANHAKVIVVDDRAFYLGSQNTYVANLAEFGMIVDDAAATSRFVRDYLEKAERWSKRTTIGGSVDACPYR